MRRLIIGFLLAMLLSLIMLPGSALAQPELKTWDDLSGKRVGLVTGMPFEKDVHEKNASAEVVYFNTLPDMILALQAKKIDACIAASPIATLSVNRNKGLAVFPEVFFTSDFGTVFPKGSPIYPQWNDAVRRMAEDGTIDEIYEKWTSGKGDGTVPEQTWPGANGTLNCLAVSTQEPICYLSEGKTIGFEPEVALRVAEQLDVHLNFIPTEFGEFMASIEAGKADMGQSVVLVTEERKKTVDFAVEHNLGLTLVVRDDGDAGASASTGDGEGRIPEFNSLQELEGKTIGAATGGVTDVILHEADPKIDSFAYFNTYADMVAAIKSGKVAGAMIDKPVARLLVARNEGLTLMDQEVAMNTLAFAVRKGSPLKDELSRIIDQMRKDGTLDELAAKWFDSDDEAQKTMPEEDWDTSRGTLRVVSDGTNEPFSYAREDRLVGYDIEIIALCAKELHMGLEIVNLPFNSLLASIETGKADVGACGITITEERAKEIDFTSPTYESGFSIIVRDVSTSSKHTSLFDSIAESFHKNFIVENRWQMILSGLGVTFTIFGTVAVLGTLLGFLTTMIRQGGNKVASALIKAYEGLMGRLPIVVVLMVFYYVVFGSINISGTIVAILVFTLSYGASAGAIMYNAVRAVDAGQTEASLALGFTPRETFFDIVVPDAARNFLPLLSGQLVSLAKETSVVGYISVIDLTRASDLIRARTMEAFFPLIATAIIYFVLSCAIAAIVGVVIDRVDLDRRPRKIKGVQE